MFVYIFNFQRKHGETADRDDKQQDFTDTAHVAYGNIKRIIMFTVELLYHENKWERLSSLVVKFNAITRYLLAS